MADWKKPIEVLVYLFPKIDRSEGKWYAARVLANFCTYTRIAVEIMDTGTALTEPGLLCFDAESGEFLGEVYDQETGRINKTSMRAEVHNISEPVVPQPKGKYFQPKPPFSVPDYEDPSPGCYLRNYGVASVGTTGHLRKDQVVPTTIEHYINTRDEQGKLLVDSRIADHIKSTIDKVERKQHLNLHEIIFTIASFNPDGILFVSGDTKVLANFKMCADLYGSPGGASMEIGPYRWFQIKDYATLIQTPKKKYFVKRELLTMRNHMRTLLPEYDHFVKTTEKRNKRLLHSDEIIPNFLNRKA